MLLNPENLCGCGRYKMAQAMTCKLCSTARNKGRIPTFSDDQIIDAVRSGCDTVQAILALSGLKSKASMTERVKRLASEGRLTLRIETTMVGGFKHRRMYLALPEGGAR